MIKARIPDIHDDEWQHLADMPYDQAAVFLAMRMYKAEPTEWPRHDHDTVDVEVLVNGEVRKYVVTAYLNWTFSAREERK
jgi:hypothetical protein